MTHRGIIPQKHPHMPTLPIRWSGEIGIIHPGFILDGDGDPVISLPPLPEIVALEVERLFRESISDGKNKREHDSEDE